MSTWPDGRGVVELPDGRRVRGAGMRDDRGGAPPPEYAVYLLGRRPEATPWPHRWVRWPDFRLPSSTDDAVAALQEAYARAADQRVEIACRGGIGRTGTALAVVAVVGGVLPEQAVTWVRDHYRPRAVETRRQRRWVESVGSTLNAR